MRHIVAAARELGVTTNYSRLHYRPHYHPLSCPFRPIPAYLPLPPPAASLLWWRLAYVCPMSPSESTTAGVYGAVTAPLRRPWWQPT